MAISFQYLSMLKTKVKVSKVTNLSEARYCAGMGVDFLSFPVSSVDPKTYQEITGWVAGPLFGVEIDSNPYEQYPADFVEVPFESIDKICTMKILFGYLTTQGKLVARSVPNTRRNQWTGECSSTLCTLKNAE